MNKANDYCYDYYSSYYKAGAILVALAIFFVITFGYVSVYSTWKAFIEVSGGYSDLEA